MPSKCKNLCMGVKDSYGIGYKTHNYCKVCEKWFERPTPLRCNCCNNILRLTTRYSRSKLKMEYKRIE